MMENTLQISDLITIQEGVIDAPQVAISDVVTQNFQALPADWVKHGNFATCGDAEISFVPSLNKYRIYENGITKMSDTPLEALWLLRSQ